jgi:hypothetical protein
MEQLYRHFDKEGILLYVGISYNALTRLNQHKRTALWFKDIVNVTIEQFETRKEVEEAELIAIRTEKPKYNIQGVVNISAEGVALKKWRRPKYVIKGKRFLSSQYIPLYLKIVAMLEPDKIEYDLVLSYEELEALTGILSFVAFKDGKPNGFIGCIQGYTYKESLVSKVGVGDAARTILIQARKAGDIWVEHRYEVYGGTYTANWYVEKVEG